MLRVQAAVNGHFQHVFNTELTITIIIRLEPGLPIDTGIIYKTLESDTDSVSSKAVLASSTSRRKGQASKAKGPPTDPSPSMPFARLQVRKGIIFRRQPPANIGLAFGALFI